MDGWVGGDKTEWDIAAHAIVKGIIGRMDRDLNWYTRSWWFSVTFHCWWADHTRHTLYDFEHSASIHDIPASVLMSLQNEHKITNLDAIAEYIMGGRVAMAMMKFDASDHAILCQDILYNSKRFLTSRCYYLILTPGVFILMIRWLALMLTGRGKRPMTNYKWRFQQYSHQNICRHCRRIHQ